MGVKVEVRAANVTYKCFDCLRLKNPKNDPPHVISIIASETPTPSGQIQLNLANAHLCEKCWKTNDEAKNFIPATDIVGGQPFIDKSGVMPNDKKGVPNA